MSVMRSIANVRFEGRRSEGGGGAKWTLISSSDTSEASILKLELPDGSPLKAEEIAAIDQISSERGFKNPAAVVKTLGVTAASLIIGDYFIGELIGPDYFMKIHAYLWLALETDNEEYLQQLIQLIEELPFRTGGAVIIGAGTIAVPTAYAGYALSKREIRLRITMQSGDTHNVRCPEYMGRLSRRCIQSRSFEP